MSEAWKGGSTRAWRRTRALVLQRDNHACQLKVAGTCVGRSEPMHVHHKHGKDSGCIGCRFDQPDHLEAACAPCNLSTGDPTRAPDPPAIPVTNWG